MSYFKCCWVNLAIEKSTMMKPCQTLLSQSTQQRGRTRNKRKGPTTRPKNKNLHLRGQGRGVGKSCAPHPSPTLKIIRSMLEKEKACTLEITPILDGPSPAIIAHLEIDVTQPHCNSTYTLCL
jgi:hypothetical protein